MIQADDNAGSSSSCINTFSAPADGFNSIMMVMMTTMIMLMLFIMKVEHVMHMDPPELVDALMEPMMMVVGTMVALSGAYMAIVIDELAARWL